MVNRLFATLLGVGALVTGYIGGVNKPDLKESPSQENAIIILENRVRALESYHPREIHTGGRSIHDRHDYLHDGLIGGHLIEEGVREYEGKPTSFGWSGPCNIPVFDLETEEGTIGFIAGSMREGSDRSIYRLLHKDGELVGNVRVRARQDQQHRSSGPHYHIFVSGSDVYEVDGKKVDHSALP